MLRVLANKTRVLTGYSREMGVEEQEGTDE